MNFAAPILSGFKARGAPRTLCGTIAPQQRRSRAKGALPFGNGHLWPIAASLALNVAFATPADSFVALVQIWPFKIHLIGLTGHRVDSKPHLPGRLSYRL